MSKKSRERRREKEARLFQEQLIRSLGFKKPKTRKICDITGDICMNCKNCAAETPSQGKVVYHRPLKCFEVSFRVFIPSIAQYGFQKKLETLGFLDVKMVDASAIYPVKPSPITKCPLGHAVPYPFCAQRTCDHYNWTLGCRKGRSAIVVTDGEAGSKP